MVTAAGSHYSLADSPELVGFFSYSREDDDDSRGALSALRDAIQRELQVHLGRSRRQLRLWQDKDAIVPGLLWEIEIEAAIAEATFFIPIITPTVVKSRYCQIEFEAFLDRERRLERTDLVFPILYVRVPELETETHWRNDPVLSVVGVRQWVDWRPLRLRPIDDLSVRQAIKLFCIKIIETLRAPTLSDEEPERRREEKQAQELRRQENARAAQEAEQRQREEEDRQRREEEDRVWLRQQEELRHQKEATLAQEAELVLAIAEAKSTADVSQAAFRPQPAISGVRRRWPAIIGVLAGVTVIAALGLWRFDTPFSPKAAQSAAGTSDLAEGRAAYDRKDYIEARRLFSQAANEGNVEAQLQLAILYAKGDGIAQDYASAVNWFRAAANQGLPRAQYDLGVLYERGLGVQVDLTEAANWYLKAAQGGYPLAEYNLAVCYTKGQGIRKDLSEAPLWYRRAATQGLVQAMINLGMVYEKGDGVAVSRVDAYAWYLAAGRRGNDEAARRADGVFASLSPLDQTRAKALANDVAASIHDP